MNGLSISRHDARRTALSGLVDYAGLFPPASLDMEAAVAEYRDARSGPSAWMVDRFICPASRLEELVGAMTGVMRAGDEPWPISVTTGGPESLTTDAGSVRTFLDTVGAAATADLVETRLPGDATNSAATDALRAFPTVIAFEVGWDTDVAAAFDTLAEVRADTGRALFAKIRCGGLEASLFPPPDAVARFLIQAAERSLPVKATAGLHHPVRHTDPETGFTHHGFINLLEAAALAHAGAAIGVVTGALSEADPEAFALDRSGVRWREHRFDHDALAAMRSGLLIGYGSCSVAEPVHDLTALGILPLEVPA